MNAKLNTLFLLALFLQQCRSKETKVEIHPDGKIKSKIDFIAGIRQGEAITYYPNGQMQAKHHYQNDSLFGTSLYFRDNGSISKIVTYRNGVRNGPYSIYYGNGNIAEVGNYRDNAKNGKVIKYYETDSGKLHYEFYVIGIGIEEFPYYRKRYSRDGKLEGIARSLNVTVSTDSIMLSQDIDISFELADNIDYDSGTIVIGEFDNSFRPVGDNDTIQLKNKKAHVKMRPKKMGKNYIRGKWSVIRKESDADSVYSYNTFGFFEEIIFVQ